MKLQESRITLRFLICRPISHDALELINMEEKKTSRVGLNHLSLFTLVSAPRFVQTDQTCMAEAGCGSQQRACNNCKVRCYFLHVQGQGLAVVCLVAVIKSLDKVIYKPWESVADSLGG